MNCMICQAQLNTSPYCPKCGCNVTAQKKAVALSNLYYNQGLEKAQIRDLSGAITCLKRSLKMNKCNIQARNLLGLVYFETGEVVAALSEWVISKNIMPEGNVASDYINKLQSNANRLDTINTSIKKYNQCLAYCRTGNLDMAKMQLKKVLTSNPKLIKGYHLLSLIYIKEEAYEKARKQLKIAAKIDKTNTTTLRFLREVDDQTGRMTSLEPRFRAKEKNREEKDGRVIYNSGNDTIIQPPEYRERTVTNTLINLIIGLLVGASALWFLIVPAKTQKINNEANKKIVEYSDKVATQAAEIDRMQQEIDASSQSVNTANEQIAQANTKSESYDNLIKAWQAYNSGNYQNAANALESVDASQLSVDAKAMYDTIMNEIGETVKAGYKSTGITAYEGQDYAAAIDNLLKAQEIGDPDYDSMFYLAQSYQKSGDNANAIVWYQKIIDAFPGTSYASDAKDYMTAIGGTPTGQDGGGDGSQAPADQREPQDDTGGETDEGQDNGGGEDGLDSGNTDGNQDDNNGDNNGDDNSGDDNNGEGDGQDNLDDTGEE